MSCHVVVLNALEYSRSRQLLPMQETRRRLRVELAGCWMVSPDWCSDVRSGDVCRTDCRQRPATASRWSHIMSWCIHMFCRIACVMLMCHVRQQWWSPLSPCSIVFDIPAASQCWSFEVARTRRLTFCRNVVTSAGLVWWMSYCFDEWTIMYNKQWLFFSMCLGRISVEESLFELLVSISFYFYLYIVYCDEDIFTIVNAGTVLYCIIWLRDPEDEGDSVFRGLKNLPPNGIAPYPRTLTLKQRCS